MLQKIKTTGILGAVLVVSACGATFDYDALRLQNDESGKFSAELGQAYKKFALYEYEQMADWVDGAHFGAKAQQAFASEKPSKTPVPEKLENWWLTDAQKQLLGGARKRLVHILDPQSKKQLPKVAAAAQVNFDCWLEQQEENWQLDDIEKCRRGFYAAIERLEEMAALARSNYLAVPKTNRNSARVVPARQTLISTRKLHETRTYTLHFSFDKAVIDQASEAQIDRVVQDYRAGAPVAILLAGHADRAGKKPYNLNLSRLRSEAVRRALIERGIPVQLIAAQAFGESRPKVKTVDGMKEQRNRRVEITVGPAPAL